MTTGDRSRSAPRPRTIGRWAAAVLGLALLGILVFSTGPLRKLQIRQSLNGSSVSNHYWTGRDRSAVLRWILGSKMSWTPCSKAEFEELFKQVDTVEYDFMGDDDPSTVTFVLKEPDSFGAILFDSSR